MTTSKAHQLWNSLIGLVANGSWQLWHWCTVPAADKALQWWHLVVELVGRTRQSWNRFVAPATQKTSRLWNRLVEPTKGLDVADYYDAKLLAGISLVIVVIGAVLQFVIDPLFWSYARGTTGTLFVDAIGLVVVVAILVVAGAYVLARTRYFKWSLYIILWAAFVALFVALIVQREVAPVNSMLVYLFVPMVMVLVLLRSVWQMCAGVLLILVAEFAIVAIPGTVLTFTEVVAFVQPQLLVVGIVIIAGMHRNLVERARLDQLRKAAEQAELGRQQAEEAQRQQNEFLANVSHELRTPLNAITGFAGIIEAREEMAPGSVDPRTLESVGRIRSNGMRLVEQVNSILDLAKLSKGIELDFQPICPAKVVEQLAEELKGLAKENVSFAVDVQDVSCELLADAELVRKVVRNLIGNAFKFTEEGCVAVRLKMSESGDWWIIEVADTGIGIAPEHHETIFEDFRQADGSIRRRFGGTGLGLAFVRRATEAMGGNVGLESALGKGATFTVTLPMRRAMVESRACA